MKKIIYILILITSLISCTESSKNEVVNNPLQLKLLGTWENAGYYDDVENPNTNSNYYPSPNGVTITFNLNSYSSTYLGNPYENGLYSISNDSILSYDGLIQGKISVLNNEVLEIVNQQQLGGIRYEKVNPNTNISGK